MADMCGDNRFKLIELCKKDFLENTNISEDEKRVLDSICFRMWQLGLLKKYDIINSEKMGYRVENYRPFNEGDMDEFTPEQSSKITTWINDAFKAGYRWAYED